MALARRPNIAQRIIKSVAPSIHGHADVKEAIALAMFGGQRKARGWGFAMQCAAADGAGGLAWSHLP